MKTTAQLIREDIDYFSQLEFARLDEASWRERLRALAMTAPVAAGLMGNPAQGYAQAQQANMPPQTQTQIQQDQSSKTISAPVIDHTQWGISLEQVKNDYPAAQFDQDTNQLTVKVQVGGIPWQASLFFTEDEHLLYRAEFQAVQHVDQQDAVAVTQSLISRFGQGKQQQSGDTKIWSGYDPYEGGPALWWNSKTKSLRIAYNPGSEYHPDAAIGSGKMAELRKHQQSQQAQAEPAKKPAEEERAQSTSDGEPIPWKPAAAAKWGMTKDEVLELDYFPYLYSHGNNLRGDFGRLGFTLSQPAEFVFDSSNKLRQVNVIEYVSDNAPLSTLAYNLKVDWGTPEKEDRQAGTWEWQNGSIRATYGKADNGQRIITTSFIDPSRHGKPLENATKAQEQSSRSK